MEIEVGGGAYRHTFNMRVAVTPDGALCPAVSVRSNGDLACRGDQAVVEGREGNYLFEATGAPIPGEGETVTFTVFQVRAGELVLLTPEEADVAAGKAPEIPTSAWDGALAYHNRDGRLFVKSERVG